MDWPRVAAAGPAEPSRNCLQSSFGPLLEQVRIDATQQITTLAENRAGHRRPDHQRAAGRANDGTHSRPRLSVAQRDQRHHDGPLAHGSAPVARTAREVPTANAAESDSVPDLRQFYAAVELFYPGSRRGAAGPLEYAAESFEQEGELLEVS